MRLALGALGVVFGDIGTSPLYAFRESFIGVHRLPIDSLHVMGVLSLIVWALILVVTVKYVLITMRADNRGEGGSFALLALIRRVSPGARLLPAISLGALLATALFYGDAVITPAISILSAVEGLTLADERFGVVVVPITLVITLALFAIQHRGAGGIGRFFGPVMLVWFITIAVLGAVNIAGRPDVVAAASPTYALAMIAKDPLRAFLTLGTVVLTITGAEALYADMGHFGRRPISRAWMAAVLPALLLCYAGQAALVLDDPAAVEQAFFLLAPRWALWPLLALATAATVIASQSAITGAFSITQQAIQLGYLPRLTIVHTSEAERGQVFAPAVNALLCVAVIGLVLGFQVVDGAGSRLRFCRDLDHGVDDADHGLRHLPHLAPAHDLGGLALCRPAGLRRRPVRRFGDQDPGRCLAAAGDRGRADGAVHHVGARPDAARRAPGGGGHAGRGFLARHRRYPARAWPCGLFHARRGRCAHRFAAQPEASSRAARTRPAADHTDSPVATHGERAASAL